ncbi:MAG: DegT/DnrJ/EryC1/StrS family aminotransferase [Bacteroidales bacterium]
MINLSKPYFDDCELDAIKKTFDSGWVAGQGPKNEELSELICQFTGSKFAIPVNNCTSGLHLALLALGILHGDEVIVSDFTFPATGHSVMYCGAIPRFVDVKLSTYNIDPDLIEEKINRKTKAIIVVHALGQMAEMDAIVQIVKENKLFLIEDAACSLGAEYKGSQAGRFGDITAVSFHARKNVTSGEGGILLTDNDKFASTVKSLSCFGTESAFARQNEFIIPVFNQLGYNYKLSDINAAIAIEQLKKYPQFLNKRFAQVELYNKLLQNKPLIQIPRVANGAKHVFQTYAILLDEKINRNRLIVQMRSEGIQTQIGTYSSYIQPVYRNTNDVCPNSRYLFEHTLALPLFYELTEAEIKKVVERLMSNINI